MDTGKILERSGVIFTRVIVVFSTLLGFYLLIRGTSLLQRVFGIALVLVGLFLTYHHSVVVSRGAMRSQE